MIRHNEYMRGTVITEAETAEGLGFASVEQMNRFYALMKIAEPRVAASVKRWFGSDNSQIVFEIASECVQAMLEDGQIARVK